ncbi:unnamed protein product [Leptosia nina]|uniref:Uncharacterized protein n=1 Tax=Leptosia nina TaxID=320188 RepID=A0AAV1J3X3_9NEOP
MKVSKTSRASKPVQPVMPTTEERSQTATTETIPPLVSSTPAFTPPTAIIPPSAATLQSTPSTIPIAAIQPMPKSSESFKPSEEANTPSYPEKPTFVQPKAVSQSPKISPSSIPNPSPSVTTTKPVQLGYTNYGCYMYSVPVYSAFQPVSYPAMVQPNQASTKSNQPNSAEIVYPIVQSKDGTSITSDGVTNEKPIQPHHEEEKSQTDFEEQFMPKVIPAVTETSNSESHENRLETINSPAPIITTALNKDANKKVTPERYSLKTSIPISKIDMKCVSSPSESLQSTLPKKTAFNPAFHAPKPDMKMEIQSNVLLNDKNLEPSVPVSTNSIGTLITAAEVINQAETQFRKPESKQDCAEQNKDQSCIQSVNSLPPRTIFNPINLEAMKPNFSQPQDRAHNEKKNQILLIQNKNSTSQKMLLAIQQQNPQALHQRTSIEQKNSQAPSRPSSQTKKCKEEVVNENSTSSKVVSLKRMHQEDCDENDFENLITENQIYGNKIVVKEKSQGTLQEQDIKNKQKIEKSSQPQTNNVVFQPNIVYLSNVQFPANVMMIKNNIKINNESTKNNTSLTDSNHTAETPANTDIKVKHSASRNIQDSKEIHVMKSINSVVQKLGTKTSKADLVFQTPNPKVMMNPQILCQVPMIIDRDKLNQHVLSHDGTKCIDSPIDDSKKTDTSKPNDNVFIACQVDSKLQPKILITNIRSKSKVIEEVSSLDLYEKRKRLRRLKHLTHRDGKESKKMTGPPEDTTNNIITPDKIVVEICYEFIAQKSDNEEIESESDYEDDDIYFYSKIMEDYGHTSESHQEKEKFLACLRLATFKDYEEREMDRKERILQKDAVASAYITAGRLDCLTPNDSSFYKINSSENEDNNIPRFLEENGAIQQQKQAFLARLRLTTVSKRDRDGYEKIWREIIKERRRRERPPESFQTKQRKLEIANLNLDTSGQLKLLTEIKNQVNENNNLIKKKIDSYTNAGESIKVLAEKNFSELNRLSKIADISVKHYSGQDARKRDLNPGFDSENIQAARPKLYTHINVPNIYKNRISDVDASKDESKCNIEEFKDGEKFRDASCQASTSHWLGLESFIKSYKEYEAGRLNMKKIL